MKTSNVFNFSNLIFRCSTCGEGKPLSSFYFGNKRCRDCCRSSNKAKGALEFGLYQKNIAALQIVTSNADIVIPGSCEVIANLIIDDHERGKIVLIQNLNGGIFDYFITPLLTQAFYKKVSTVISRKLKGLIIVKEGASS